MSNKLYFASALLAFSAVASAQFQDGLYQIGYAANLNIGDSVVNISNDGLNAGFVAVPATAGNICVNVYTFDASEEMLSCCACLVTPDGLVSLSVKNDLINDTLTSAVPDSVVIKLLSSEPATSGTTAASVVNVCDPSGTGALLGGVPPPVPFLLPADGMLAWGTTLEPAATPGTYGVVPVKYINATTTPFPLSEYDGLLAVCGFLQQNGSGFGICSSCSLGALSGTKH